MSARGLRVLHCIPSIWSGSGGPSRAVIEMCRALKEANPANQSDIATSDHGLAAPWLDYVRSRVPLDTSVKIFPESKWLDKGWSLALVVWLWKAAREYDVIHIHALFSSTSSAAAWVARQKKIPYVIRPLGTLSPYTFANRRTYLKSLYFSLLDKKTLFGASAIHYTTSQEAKKAERLHLPARGVVVPLPYFSNAAAQRAPSFPETILFLSRLHPVKGIELLLGAMAAVRASGSLAQLVIAGSGDRHYEASVRQMASQLNLDNAVSFVGFVEGEKKAKLLDQASIFVLPSYQENFGLAVAEALAHGLPVVVTQGVDLSEDIMAYASGYVVKHDVKELADALLALLANPKQRATMGENGRRQVLQLYSPERVGVQLESLYKSILVGGDRG